MIEIWTEELPKGWEWTPDCFVGGTPEFIVETARVLSNKNDVIVYYDGPAMEFEGVFYVPRKGFTGQDIVLACNSRPPSNGKYSIYYTNWYHQRQSQCEDYDERIVLSKYHQGLFGSRSRIVPHSCWPQKFANPTKIKGKCLFSSSPDRGLNFIKSIWSRVEKETGAQLVVTYDKNISEDEMVEHYKSAEFWLHPGIGIELFCISAVKAQVAKAIPVVVPEMALAETVKFGVKTNLRDYEDQLISAIKNPPAIENVDFGSWETVTKKLFKNTHVTI